MRRCWYYGQGPVVVCNGQRVWDYRPYLYVVSRERPRAPGTIYVERVDYTPYEFDGLRYAPSSGPVWRVVYPDPSRLKHAKAVLGAKLSQSYIPYTLRIAGDIGLPTAILKSPQTEIPRVALETYERAKTLRILAFDVEEVNGRIYVGFSLDGRDVKIIELRRGEKIKPSDIPDADYIVGYNSWKYDVAYLPAPTRYAVATPRGLVPHIDLYPTFKGGFGSALGRSESSLGLYDVARQLGIHKALGISDADLYRIKSLRRRLSNLPEKVVKAYLWTDVRVTWLIADTAVRIMETVGALVGANAMVVAQAAEKYSPAVLFEYLAHRRLMEVEGGVFVDRRREWEYEAGEKVFAARPGVFHNVAEYDFNAMYPTLISQDGVDPTSARECPDGFPVSLYKDGATKTARICWRGGPVHELLVGALQARKTVKKVSKAADQALKILINAAYGTMAKGGTGIINEWASAYIAQRSTAIHAALRAKYKPIYGDTDSIYLPEVAPEAADALLNEINDYVKRRWGGPYSEELGIWLELKLEALWERMWIAPKEGDSDDDDEEGEASGKNYIKIKGDEVVVKGGALKAHDLPIFLRYGKYYTYAKALLMGHATVGDVIKELYAVPLEEAFAEASRTYEGILFVRDRKNRGLKKPDGFKRHMGPFLAALVFNVPVFVANYSFDGRAWDVETEPEIPSLDEFLDVLYLPVETEGPTKSYILYDTHEETPYLVSYTADFDNDRIVVTRTQKRPVPEDTVRERAKTVILDHPLFAYFAQSRLL